MSMRRSDQNDQHVQAPPGYRTIVDNRTDTQRAVMGSPNMHPRDDMPRRMNTLDGTVDYFSGIGAGIDPTADSVQPQQGINSSMFTAGAGAGVDAGYNTIRSNNTGYTSSTTMPIVNGYAHRSPNTGAIGTMVNGEGQTHQASSGSTSGVSPNYEYASMATRNTGSQNNRDGYHSRPRNPNDESGGRRY